MISEAERITTACYIPYFFKTSGESCELKSLKAAVCSSALLVRFSLTINYMMMHSVLEVAGVNCYSASS